MTEAALHPAAKVDPETLASAAGRRAIRFKCGAIIAIATLGSESLTAVTFMALGPRILHHGEAQDDLAEPLNAPSDAPATYGDAPKLGPPLSGISANRSSSIGVPR